MVAEVRKLDNLDDIAAWMVEKLPGAFALHREVGGAKRSLPMLAMVKGAKFTIPLYVRTMGHHTAFPFLGLPVGKPGEKVPIYGYTATLDMETVGGSWWNPLILRRLGMFPSSGMNYGRRLVRQQMHHYRVVMRAEEWPMFVVMQRLKGDDDDS